MSFESGFPLKLAVTHSRLFNAHWALLVPNSIDDDTTYTKIHVTGSLAEGFVHEFQRAYSVPTDRSVSTYHLATANEAAVAKSPGVDVGLEDTITATNKLEEVALSVPAPGPSLRSASSTKVTRIEVKDCQYWLKKYVASLVDEGLVTPNANDELAKAPVH